jgi:hypothetical protein
MSKQRRSSGRPEILLIVALTGTSLIGCIARERINLHCEWTHDAPAPLNVSVQADRRHLAMDAWVAEELSIRYADALRGHRSDHWAGQAEYRGTRDRCLAQLVATIAARHSVDDGAVRGLFAARPIEFDVVILAAFGVLYAFAAFIAAGAVARRFPQDDAVPAIVATGLVALVMSATGVMAFILWAAIAEMIRVGSQHMSYRAARMPWHGHEASLFVMGIMLVLVAAILRYRRMRVLPAAERKTLATVPLDNRD